MSSSHSAAAPLAGYLWQVRRAFLTLLRGDFGEALQIETVDDFVMVKDGKSIVAAMQAKHHFGEATLTIGSTEWWRTLCTWLDLMREQPLAQDTQLILCTTGTVSSEMTVLTASPRRAQVIADLLAAHDEIARRRTNAQLLKAYASWEMAPAANRQGILTKAIIESAQPKLSTSRVEIDNHLRRCGIPQGASLDMIRERLLGWFQGKVEARLDSGGCEIRYEELNDHLTELLYELNPRALTCAYSQAPAPPLSAERVSDPNYLRQLTLLNATDEVLTLAVAMHHRATAERNYWMNERIAAVGTLKSYDADLLNTWSQKRTNVERSIGQVAEVDRGWRLYESCMDYRGAINGVSAPTHVANGTFHMLADQPTDSPDIGWHPRYPELLRREGT